MSKGRFVVALLAALIIIGLLAAGGLALHRIGWLQGYRVGQLTAGGDGVAPLRYAAYGFGFSGLLITVVFLLLLFFVIGRLFRFWLWRSVAGPWGMRGGPWKMPGGPKGEYWFRHRHWHHGPMHPQYWGWQESPEEETEQAEPGGETRNA